MPAEYACVSMTVKDSDRTGLIRDEATRGLHERERGHRRMFDESDVPTVIRSAGGLVWRKVGGRKELAVIQRLRYGGDWTLPKGKLEPGESWQEAALREVQEETGCRVRLGRFAGSVTYLVDSVPKIVLFWNMPLVGDCRFVPSDEVDALSWLPVNEAIETLDYEGERALVKKNL